MTISSSELARQHRDELFEAVNRMMLVGLVTPEYREATRSLLAAPVGPAITDMGLPD